MINISNMRIFDENDLISSVADYSGNLEDQRITLANFREFASSIVLEDGEYVVLVNTYNNELLAAYVYTGQPVVTDDGAVLNDLRAVSDRVGKKIAKILDKEFAFPGWKSRKLIRVSHIYSGLGTGLAAVGAIAFAIGVKKILTK